MLLEGVGISRRRFDFSLDYYFFANGFDLRRGSGTDWKGHQRPLIYFNSFNKFFISPKKKKKKKKIVAWV
jgi:hypothetical protein